MFKVEIKFNSKTLSEKNMQNICNRVDDIFAREGLPCSKNAFGERVYEDRGRKDDYGRFWAAFFSLKNSKLIVNNMTDAFWYNQGEKKELLDGFLKS